MASAGDIITYIGVPLAVLGVLPIIWNTISTLITLANVRRALRRSRLLAMARGDVVNHVIEVELPRYTLAPLHRELHRGDYWRLADAPSAIPGGSWTTFHWRSNVIGLKTQRMTYSDQLRQPQAEIGFEALVGFLLDLGAVPDATGFRNLRNSGLWAPLGTALLRSPDGQHAVLTIAPLDDSDGNLSLAVRWSSDWGMRDAHSLPPYWVALRGDAGPARPATAKEEDEEEPGNACETKSLTAQKYTPHPPPSIRCQVGVAGLLSVTRDEPDVKSNDDLDMSHLDTLSGDASSAGIWYASALTALSSGSSAMLWNYTIPTAYLAFAKMSSIPCGLLVLLDVLPESQTPEWATQYPHTYDEECQYKLRQMRDDQAALQREALLPPEQRQQAIRDRQSRNFQDFVDRGASMRRREAERADLRIVEALQSPKWSNKLVAQHQLAWLKTEGHVEASWDVARAVESLLWRMVHEQQLTGNVVAVLDLWRSAVDNGGLRRAEYVQLQERQLEFAWASLVCAMVGEVAKAAQGSLASDLQECVRIFKTVRLG